jgi:prevent-host-death family protein
MKSISAADANRHFSALLREVSRGARVTVTSRGKPVATISAADPAERRERISARRALLRRLRARPATGTRNWSRDELYGKRHAPHCA